MTSDHDIVWCKCIALSRVVLPLVDREPWRQERRRDNLRAWGIHTRVGEQLIETLAALAAHAVAVDASLSATDFDTVALSTVAEAATGKQDFELLAGLPGTFTGDRDEHAVMVFRLYAYESDQSNLQLIRLRTELRHALVILAERSPVPSRTCGDVLRLAAEIGLSP
jgi:hypothetical protein